ncbi:MAG: putative glycosyl transferase [Acidimicrobiales bacterium]|nr:putative glycosyl transferase [Acidimicrobiales bacterium]
MRVLFVAWRDLANELAGGSEVLIDQLAAGLARRGHDVALMCAEPIGSPRAYRVQPNGGTVSQYVRAPLSYLRHFRDRDLVIDVANGLSFYTPFWRRGPALCFVNHIHTEQWSQWFPAPVAAMGRLLEQRAMPAAYRNRLFVAVSPSTAQGLERLGVEPDNIRIIINGTDIPDEIGVEADEPLFVGLGRLVPHKRFELLVQAWERVRPVVGGRLVIAGDGPERERLADMAGPGVEIVGKISEAEKQKLLASAWLMVHPASHEGWGLVIMEAAAHGTPALAFRVPGLRDSVADGYSGVLVDDPNELAEAWIQLATDHAYRQRLSEGARTRAGVISWDLTVARFEEICDEAIERHRVGFSERKAAWTPSTPPVPELVDEPVVELPPELVGVPLSTGRPQRRLSVVLDRPALSVVLPAYNEAARLPISLPVLIDGLAASDVEIILVDDGSSDATLEVASRLLRGVKGAGVLSLGRHAGKGGAVRAGIARATGRSIAFMDADLATDLSYLPALRAGLESCHISIGSRSAPGALTSGVTPSSDAAHRAFNHLARTSTGMAISDFQCGFKAFRAPVAKLLFHLLEEEGYAFDVEVLALADRIGYSITEVPVHWRAVRGSHVRIVLDSLAMTVQVTRIGRRARGGHQLASLEAFSRSADMTTDQLAQEVRKHLDIEAPVVPWQRGALALLPFVEPADTTELAHDLEERLTDVLVRPSMLDAGEIFDPSSHRLRSALAAS